MRDYIESYNHIKPKAVRLVGISNPHGGIFCGVSVKCPIFGEFPDFINEIFYEFGYTSIFQDHLALANYWLDPY